MSEKLNFKQVDTYVYFIRPKPTKNFVGSGVFLSVAQSEEQAWSFVLDVIGKEYKSDYYIDDIFLSHTGQSLGLMWGDEKTT